MVKKSNAEKISWGSHVQPEPGGESKKTNLHTILKGCRNKDASYQEKLYKKFYGYAMGVALSYSRTREDAIEVVNDSFMKTFKNIHTYSTSKPFKPWFRKIVVNTAIDKARAQKRFSHHMDIDEISHHSTIDIETELNAREIYNLLNELPDLLRFVFNMYEIEGYSHKEIAEKLSIAESSSRTYLTRAKSQLKILYNYIFMEEQ